MARVDGCESKRWAWHRGPIRGRARPVHHLAANGQSKPGQARYPGAMTHSQMNWNRFLHLWDHGLVG